MEQLIKAAKEKGFECIFVNIELIYSIETEQKSDYEYLWMCELQKWLRDKHKIYVTIGTDLKGTELCNDISFDFLVSNSNDTPLSWREYFETYEDALKQGLIEALKLI